MAWADGVVKTAREGVLTLEDGTTATAKTVVVTLDRGDISVSQKQNLTVIKDRGVLDHFREGEDEPIAISFSGYYTGLTAASADTLYDCLFGVGTCSDWTSTSDGESDIHTVSFQLVYTCIDGSSTETITITKFACQEVKLDEAMDGNTISITGIALDKAPTIVQA